MAIILYRVIEIEKTEQEINGDSIHILQKPIVTFCKMRGISV